MLRLLAVGILLAATMAPPVEAEWAAFRNDSRNTGTVPNANYPVFVDVWWNNKTLANAQIKATPVLKDQLLIVADMAGNVRALDAESGKQVWAHKMTAGVEGTPAIAGERVYVADLKGALRALNLRTGVVEHEASVGATRASITFHENKVFIGNEVGEMRAFLATTLTLLWTFKMGEYSYIHTRVDCPDSKGGARFAAAPIRGSPAVYDHKVIFGTVDKYIFAVDDAGLDGGRTKVMWVNKTNDVIVGSPAIYEPAGGAANAKVIVGSYDGKVYSLPVRASSEGTNPCNGVFNPATWTREVDPTTSSTRIHSSAGISADRAIVGATNGQVYALNAATGAILWNRTAGSIIEPVTSSPTIAGNIVIIGSEDKNVYWLDATTGAELKRFSTQSAVQTSAAIDGARAFIAAQDGTTYMFGPEIPKRPDLQVTAIVATEDGVSITSKNIGDAASTPTLVRILQDGTFLANVDLPAIEPGKTATVVYEVELEPATSVSFTAIVDPDAAVEESVESNNQLKKNVVPPEPAKDEDDGDGGGGGIKIPAPGLAPLLAVLALAALALRRRR